MDFELTDLRLFLLAAGELDLTRAAARQHLSVIGAGLEVGIVPESAALRNRAAAKLALIPLTDGWNVRERYVLARNVAQLPGYARDLVEAVRDDHAERVTAAAQ